MPSRPSQRATTLWEQGHEPGRQLVALGVAVTLSAAVLDLLLSDDLGLFFDLCFVALCLALALLVRPTDFFAVGVLPPLLMLGVLVLLDVTRPEVLGDPRDGVVQSVVTGLAQHSSALMAGYVLCLAALAIRHRFVARSGTGEGGRYAANRPGSPAPTRTTSG